MAGRLIAGTSGALPNVTICTESGVAPTRKFVDSEGIHWQVYELSGDSLASGLSEAGWLYFFSRDATRSLAAYPDDWAVMFDPFQAENAASFRLS